MKTSLNRPLLSKLIRRGFVWLLIGLTVLALESSYSRPVEHVYVWLAWLLMTGLVITIYELHAHWLFPRFLYAGRWVPFIGLTVGVYALVWGLTYGLYPVLQSVARVPESQITIQSYPHLYYWFTVYTTDGPFSRSALFVMLGTPYFFASPFLAASAFRQYLAQRRQTQQTELDNLKVSNENDLLELDLLKAQLNPHFLFNSLNSIYVRVIDVDERTANLVLRLAELMRYNLYEADAPGVALAQELNYIENYLALEKARHGDRVEILFSNEGDWEGLTIAPLILLSFVENAFKHGIGGTQQHAYVWIEAHLEQTDTLVFTVQNSLAAARQRHFPDRKTGGVGLLNVQQRLTLLYPDAFTIDVEQDSDQYSVTLSLQLSSGPVNAVG